MIQTWGTWPEYQALLQVLASVAAKHGVSLTNAATRWVLQQPAVGAVIVGTRLGVSSHVDENLRTFGFRLDDADLAAIDAAALGPNREKARALYVERVVSTLPLEFRGNDPNLRRQIELVVEGFLDREGRGVACTSSARFLCVGADRGWDGQCPSLYVRRTSTRRA